MRRAVLSIALTLATAAPVAATPASRLAAAARRYETHLVAERPDLASRAGIRHADARLEPVTEATLQRDAATLAALSDALDAIDRDALPRRERVTLDTLRARVAREIAPLRSGAWRADPDLYLALAHGAPLESASRPRTNTCERARRTAARLRAVPEVLRAAQVNLGAALIADPEAAAARWRAAMLDFRERLPVLFNECHDAERYAAFVEADSSALAAMGRFTRFLLERGPVDPPAGSNR